MTETIEPNCYICSKPVKLEEAKTDAGGQAIHGECYVVATLLHARSKPRVGRTVLAPTNPVPPKINPKIQP